MSWLLTVPAWGSKYIEQYLNVTLPAVNVALEHATGDIRFIVHTDKPEAFDRSAFRGSVEFRPIDVSKCYDANGHANYDAIYKTYGHANRDALSSAREGEYVMLTGCDTIISREFFQACEHRFAQGYKCIFGTAPRTVAEPHEIPIGAASRELLDWSFSRRHPVTDGCFWGKGCNTIAWAIYFEGPRGIVCRSFHLPPFAVVADRPLWFHGTTVDIDLVERFKFEELFVITDPGECSFAEISDNSKSVVQGAPLCQDSVVSWAMQAASPWHCHLFRSRIVIQGTSEDNLDIEPCHAILDEIHRRRGKKYEL